MAVIGLIMATHHFSLVARLIGLAMAVVAYAFAIRLLVRRNDSKDIPGATGGVLVLAGGLGLLGDQLDLLPFSVLLVGIAVFVFGIGVVIWARKTPSERSRIGAFVAVLVAIGIGLPTLIASVTGLFVMMSDAYVSRYGTPVTVTISAKCRYYKTNRGGIIGNPDCPGSTWQLNGKAKTGDLKVNWSDSSGSGSAVPARAIGGKAVAVSSSKKKDDKASIGSLTRLVRLPYKWPIAIVAFAALCCVPLSVRLRRPAAGRIAH